MGLVGVIKAVLTGGLWNASDALEDASNAADAANAVITAVAADLHLFIEELEKLFSIRRWAPRSEEELWDEEVNRLRELRTKITELEQQRDNITNPFKKFMLDVEISILNDLIDEILYNEPGVIPVSINQFKMTLERFNTVDQPLIEDNLEEMQQILVEIKKLFVNRRFVLIDPLGERVQQEIQVHEGRIQEINEIIADTRLVAGNLQSRYATIHTERNAALRVLTPGVTSARQPESDIEND